MKQFRLLLLVLVAFGFTSPAPVKLAYTFKQGESFLLSQTTTQQMKQSIMGMDQSMENNSEAEMLFKVLEVTKENAKLEVSYVRLKTTVKSPQINTEMDSQGTADTRENKLFKGMVNKPFYIWMSRFGKIEKVEGIDTLMSALKDAGIDESATGGLKNTLESYMGEQGLKATIQKTLITYPENPLKKGDTWKNVQTMSVPFAFTTDDTWSLADQNDNAISLTGQGLFTTDKEKTMDLPGGLKAKVDLSGNQLMKSTVNPKTNWPTTTEVISEVKGKMLLLAGGPIPEDMEMPMEIHTETRSTITKK
jgi:hypothetical protein